MEELIRRYDELYSDMATARDPKKMMTFGEAEKWMFHSLAERHPEMAEKWLSRLESGRWNNYLSRSEAEEIASNLVNQDGSRGAHWNFETFKSAVESLGGKISEEPYYNCWALWAVMNMLYSDHHRSVSSYIPRDKEPYFFYAMAVEKLKDVDRPKFVRWYFDV